MYKKLFGSIFLATALMFFVSCQEQDSKKDDQKKASYQRNGRKGTYQRGKPSQDAAMPTRTCPKDKPCPPEPKKTCPNGCKKKCCVNEEALLQEKQEIISLQDLTNKDLPLEQLKAAIENDSLEME
ncbi:MAG: hypothetical protein K1060chlam1_01208 [Candidatus Anoxychlamydiales bacterium]|nr:hypothetical protein [Candidatus Anoxychlamydiales bacterium]